MNLPDASNEDSVREPALRLFSYEEYRLAEATADVRSEYRHGRVYPKSTGTFAHAVLSANVIALLRSQSRHSGKAVMDGSIRLRIESAGLDTYPDAVVVCGPRQLLDDQRDVLLNPALIVEVVSPQSEAYDRGMKAQQYRSIGSLTYYLLVAEDRYSVQLQTRSADGAWLVTDWDRREDTIEIAALGYRLPLAEIYDGIILAEPKQHGPVSNSI